MEALAARQGRPVWLEKSPENLHYAETIAGYLPDSRFIHILREGKDVARSMLAAAEANPSVWRGMHRSAFSSISQCADRWADDVALSWKFRADPAHTFVKYERLVEGPERELTRVFRAVGLNPSSEVVDTVLRSHREAAAGLVMPHESWKANNTRELANRAARDDAKVAWESELDRAVRRKVDRAYAMLADL